jgi:hypothetical protein
MNNLSKNAVKTPRLAGAGFLIIIVTSLLMGVLVSFPDNISGILIKISENLGMTRISILFALVTSAGVVALAVLLYTILKKQNKILALIALGWWLAEAIVLAIGKMGTAALIPLSRDFMGAGAPDSSFYQTMGNFLYNGMDKTGMALHMIFYCLGGILWYYLFFKSKYIPRIIPLFGLAAASAALVGNVVAFFGYAVPIWVSIPLLPFELAIGLWLVIKGINDREPAQVKPILNGTR